MKTKAIVSFLVFLFCAALLFPMATQIPAVASGEEVLWESFEKGNSWQVVGDKWKDNDSSTKIKIVTEMATEGKKSLCAGFKFAKSNAATYYIEDLGKWSNWTKYARLKLDIYNPTSMTLKLALALSTGSSWEWFESDTVDVNPGLNTGLVFALMENNFKAASSNWQFTTGLKKAEEIRRVALKFFGTASEHGEVYIDNIRLVLAAE